MAETETKREGPFLHEPLVCEAETGPATCDQTGTVGKASSPPNFREDRDWYRDRFCLSRYEHQPPMDEIEMVFT